MFQMKSYYSEEKVVIQQEYDNHLDSADYAYKSKENDKKLAAENNTVKVLVFDMQQCLPTPVLSSNIAYYKIQLWVYNLTVRDCNEKINSTECFIWHEGIERCGSEQIASCLHKKIM